MSPHDKIFQKILYMGRKQTNRDSKTKFCSKIGSNSNNFVKVDSQTGQIRSSCCNSRVLEEDRLSCRECMSINQCTTNKKHQCVQGRCQKVCGDSTRKQAGVCILGNNEVQTQIESERISENQNQYEVDISLAQALSITTDSNQLIDILIRQPNSNVAAKLVVSDLENILLLDPSQISSNGAMFRKLECAEYWEGPKIHDTINAIESLVYDTTAQQQQYIRLIHNFALQSLQVQDAFLLKERCNPNNILNTNINTPQAVCSEHQNILHYYEPYGLTLNIVLKNMRRLKREIGGVPFVNDDFAQNSVFFAGISFSLSDSNKQASMWMYILSGFSSPYFPLSSVTTAEQDIFLEQLVQSYQNGVDSNAIPQLFFQIQSTDVDIEMRTGVKVVKIGFGQSATYFKSLFQSQSELLTGSGIGTVGQLLIGSLSDFATTSPVNNFFTLPNDRLVNLAQGWSSSQNPIGGTTAVPTDVFLSFSDYMDNPSVNILNLLDNALSASVAPAFRVDSYTAGPIKITIFEEQTNIGTRDLKVLEQISETQVDSLNNGSIFFHQTAMTLPSSNLLETVQSTCNRLNVAFAAQDSNTAVETSQVRYYYSNDVFNSFLNIPAVTQNYNEFLIINMGSESGTKLADIQIDKIGVATYKYTITKGRLDIP